MSKIRKSTTIPSLSSIKKTDINQQLITFSFKYFDSTDPALCPPDFRNGFPHILMARLKDLSGWTIKEFVTYTKRDSWRIHQHNWAKTSRPDGYRKLPETHKDQPGWQFCLSANEHGRVHGIITDGIFYVIWLDHNHALYP
jgi:hypothetical protein